MEGYLTALIDWVLSWANTPYANAALAVLAFAESSIFPIPPDVLLIALCLLHPAGAVGYALICTAGSVAGGILGYGIGRYGGRPLVRRFFSDGKIAGVERYYQRYDVWAVGIAGFTPIPYKVFTVTAGMFLLNFKRFVVASAIGRGGRFFLVGALFYFFGEPIAAFIKEYLNLISILFVVLLIAGFAAIHYWGRAQGAAAAASAVVVGSDGKRR